MAAHVPLRFVARVAAACAVVLAFAAGAAVFVLASDVFLLVFAGVLVAVMLRGLAARLARHTRLAPHTALACVGAAVVVLVALVAVVIGPRLAIQADALAASLPAAVAELQSRVQAVPMFAHLLDALPPATTLLTFIPNIGPLLPVIPAALLALLQGPLAVLYVILLYAGVQFVETYLVTPKVQQDMVAIPPAVTLVAQLLAGVLAGGLGLVLAAPLAAGALRLGRIATAPEGMPRALQAQHRS